MAFFLPQLVQMLRSDDGGAVEAFLREEARRSRLFAHLLLCALRTEGTPPPEAFAPAVKRSGWQKPEDSGIWGAADRVADKACLSCPACALLRPLAAPPLLRTYYLS